MSDKDHVRRWYKASFTGSGTQEDPFRPYFGDGDDWLSHVGHIAVNDARFDPSKVDGECLVEVVGNPIWLDIQEERLGTLRMVTPARNILKPLRHKESKQDILRERLESLDIPHENIPSSERVFDMMIYSLRRIVVRQILGTDDIPMRGERSRVPMQALAARVNAKLRARGMNANIQPGQRPSEVAHGLLNHESVWLDVRLRARR